MPRNQAGQTGKRAMRRNLAASIPPAVGVAVFGISLWVLYHEIERYHYREIAQEFAAIPVSRLLPAVLGTILGYLLLTGYDVLALRHIGKKVPYRRISLASFIAYALSNNVGFAMLSGAAVRYRLYSAWGLTGIEIVSVIAFCSFTFWVGFLALGGTIFLIEPLAIPAGARLPIHSLRPLGAALLLLLAAYLAFCALRRRPVRVGNSELAVPTPRMGLLQVLISSLDWAVAGMVLYVLLPDGARVSFPQTLGVFLLAQVSGLVSQVPGGLGVFETVVLLMMAGSAPAPAILGALLAYRAIYYLMPLGGAAAFLAAHENGWQKESLRRVARRTGRWSAALAPSILAFTTFLGGAILLLSGAAPAIPGRLDWLKDILPLPVIELSHFLGSLAGIGLVLLARGIQQRLEAAYHLTAAFLTAGICFSLLKGADYEEALFLALMLAALLPSHRHFYRRSSLIGERFTLSWTAAVVVALLGSIWLGIFSHKHVEYSSDLWWRFTVRGDAPRFLRATVGAGVAALAFAVARLLRPARPEPAGTASEDLERARSIAAASEETYAYLALLGDKRFLFNEPGNAFIMYRVRGRSWVALGDPVGPEAERGDLAWRFREISDRHAGWAIFYEVGRRSLDLYVDLGLTLMKIGEEARVPLSGFSLEGGARKGLRAVVNRVEKEGCSLEVVGSEAVPALLPQMRAISEAWLAAKKVNEKSFSLGRFDEGYLRQFPAAIVRRDGELLGFANLWPGAGKEELSIDLMRYHPDAPGGVMEFLLARLMIWGGEQGYRWFNLGMAPLSGLEGRSLAPRWSRLGAFVFRHGEHFYNFQGLRQYKQKFHPVWEPKYLAAPGGIALPRMIGHLTALISDGSRRTPQS